MTIFCPFFRVEIYFILNGCWMQLQNPSTYSFEFIIEIRAALTTHELEWLEH